MDTPTRVALVTGASRGIGKACAVELARQNFDVAVLARSVAEKDLTPYPGTIHDTAALVRDQGRRALPIRADLTRMEDVAAAVATTMTEFGRIDLLVNNARYVSDADWMLFVDTPWEELDKMISVAVSAPLLFQRLVVPIMIKQGGGVIINVTSSVAWADNPHLPGKGSTGLGYPVTKASFNRVAPTLAKEVREQGIAVVNLSPGNTLTERKELSGMGSNLQASHSLRVPAVAAAYIATCADPMEFSGKYYEARDLVQDFGLMTEAELASPYKENNPAR